MHARYWLESLNTRDRLEELGVVGRKIKWILNKNNGRRRIRLIWLSIGTTGGALVNMVRKLRAP